MFWGVYMDLMEAMNKRHSVRSYTDKKIEGETLKALEEKISQVNQESGLNIQLVLNEPKAFNTKLAHYGHFENVNNYLAIVGKKGPDLSEKAGYYGEKLVLFAQTLGLNTCWVALTYGKVKDAYFLEKGEKLALVIAIGYGANQGVAHKSKTFQKVTKNVKNPPQWFVDGVNAALLAPTAINQQQFSFTLNGNKVIGKAGLGFYTKVDLGIAKYHFELGAGNADWSWG
jgi:hypothetical protein